MKFEKLTEKRIKCFYKKTRFSIRKCFIKIFLQVDFQKKLKIVFWIKVCSFFQRFCVSGVFIWKIYNVCYCRSYVSFFPTHYSFILLIWISYPRNILIKVFLQKVDFCPDIIEAFFKKATWQFKMPLPTILFYFWYVLINWLFDIFP